MSEDVSRRSFLQTSASVGAIASLLSRRASAGDVPAELTNTLPQGRLVLFGGGIGRESVVDILKEPNKDAALAGDIAKKEALVAKYDSEGIYRDLMERSNAKGKTIVCVTSSSPADAEEYAAGLKVLFKLLGASRVVTIADKTQADSQKIADVIADKKFTPLILFGGGDQGKLAEAFLNTPAYKVMQDRYVNDATFTVSGTSAGAAVVSDYMINGGHAREGEPESVINLMQKGFGLLKAIVDTHLDSQSEAKKPENRPERVKLAAKHYQCTGIGLDEGTGVEIYNGIATVIGKGRVRFIKSGMHVDLKENDTFPLGPEDFMAVPVAKIARSQGR